MPGYISIDIRCESDSCGHVWPELVKRGTESDVFGCPECSGPALRTLSAPNMTKATYRDGYKRPEGYQLGKEAQKMRAERANLPHEKRGQIDAEIRKVDKLSTTKRNV